MFTMHYHVNLKELTKGGFTIVNPALPLSTTYRKDDHRMHRNSQHDFKPFTLGF
jgi:hypothetical protein